MLIKIEPQEREHLERIAAVFGLSCRIYTMESNPLLIQAEVSNKDGSEISNTSVWYLCCTVQNRVFADRLMQLSSKFFNTDPV